MSRKTILRALAGVALAAACAAPAAAEMTVSKSVMVGPAFE